ncbi:MAG: PaaI family thioesterase [Coriobacteriia bacterium]|nr:PaaI family thioesterase [Coriobacteriia bacterium]
MALEDAGLDEIREFFARDRFTAEALGASIVRAERGHAVCEMILADRHVNAMGNIMGGVIFSLADFALAVSCNIGETSTVAISNNIRYISKVRGSKLIAESNVDKTGQAIGFYTVVVRDELGTLVAIMDATCYRRADL